MDDFPKNLQIKLDSRTKDNSMRRLGTSTQLIDFSSNDYLGFSTSEEIYSRALQILKENALQHNGASGSRLLTGNHKVYTMAENYLANVNNADAALIFNSGFDANLGLLSSVPQRGDLILYDEFCHASIRDGIRMSNAKALKFEHNNLEHLTTIAERERASHNEIYVVTESVFSMDGNAPDLKAMTALCTRLKLRLIVDEAHALGVVGTGKGLIYEQGLEKHIFARVLTFGKALGCHGAAILGSHTLIEYLVNFSRSFIYTTALPPHAVASILAAYEQLSSAEGIKRVKALKNNIEMFRSSVGNNQQSERFLTSDSAIHSCIIPTNEVVKAVSEKLKTKGYDVRPILSPTVPMGQERLRICVHSYNTEAQINSLCNILKDELNEIAL